LAIGNTCNPAVLKRGAEVKTISENKAFDGVQGVYSRSSATCNCDMTFGLFLSNLKPENLAYAMVARRQVGKIRLQKGYDHSYFFIASFIEDHIAFHSEALFSR